MEKQVPIARILDPVLPPPPHFPSHQPTLQIYPHLPSKSPPFSLKPFFSGGHSCGRTSHSFRSVIILPVWIRARNAVDRNIWGAFRPTLLKQLSWCSYKTMLYFCPFELGQPPLLWCHSDRSWIITQKTFRFGLKHRWDGSTARRFSGE